MSQHGAALQTYNQELVKYLEDMKQRRAELQKQIDLEEEERQDLERELKNLTNKILLVNDRLGKKKTMHNEYDRIIAETEASFTKILESSQLLLSMIKKEASKLHESMVKVSIDKQHRRQ